MMPGYRDPKKVARALFKMFAVVGGLIVAALYAFVFTTEASGGDHGHHSPVKVYGSAS